MKFVIPFKKLCEIHEYVNNWDGMESTDLPISTMNDDAFDFFVAGLQIPHGEYVDEFTVIMIGVPNHGYVVLARSTGIEVYSWFDCSIQKLEM